MIQRATLKEKQIFIVGGVNVDICGTSDSKILPGDSNPGRVTVSLGGVGRNIAENLVRMGVRVSMITVFGEDQHAEALRASCAELGIDLTHSLTIPGERTSTYLCLNDMDGEIALAVSDMSIYEHLTPEFLSSKMNVLNQADLVIMDTNLTQEAIEYLAEHCTAPMAADPVSVKKSVKLENAQSRLMFMKPNAREASLLCKIGIDGTEITMDEAAKVFQAKGLQWVIISLGSRGVYYNDGQAKGIMPCFHSAILNTTGCGDAFMAAAAVGFVSGCTLKETAAMGLAASAICARAESAVNPLMSLEAIESLLKEENQCI